MIAELLLCGLASTNVCSNAKPNKEIYNIRAADKFTNAENSMLKNTEMLAIEKNFNSVLENNKSYSIFSEYYYEDDDNNEMKEAQFIGPSLSKEGSASYEVVDYTVEGTFSKTNDNDWYRFYTNGIGTIDIDLYNLPDECCLELYYYDFGTEVVENWHSNHDFTKIKAINKKKGSMNVLNISTTVEPKKYFIRVFPKSGATLYTDNFYELSVNIKYKNGYNNFSWTDLRYNKGIKAVSWISDFDPFNHKAFSHYEKSSFDFVGDLESYILEKDLYSIGKNLQASLYLTGVDDETKTGLTTIVKFIKESIKSQGSSSKDVTVELKVIEGVGIVVDILFFSGALEKASKIFDEVEIGNEMVDFFELAASAEYLIPQYKALTKDIYLEYLNTLENFLAVADNRAVIQVDYYYEIFNDSQFTSILPTSETRHYYMGMNYGIELKGYSNYSDVDTLYGLSGDSAFRGRLYPLKNYADFEESINRVSSVSLRDINTSKDREVSLTNDQPNYLNDGEYHWYSFKAPITGRYQFTSNHSTDKTDTLDPYGEIYPYILSARCSSSDLICSDDNSNNDTNFLMTCSMLKDQIVYVRVRGKDWKGHGHYSLAVNYIDNGAILDYVHFLPKDLLLPCEYGKNERRKEIQLEDGTTFTVRSNRCGYVLDENNNYHLSLSCLRKNIHEAYVFFHFDKPISHFSFDTSLWGSKELIADGNTDLTIGVCYGKGNESPELYKCLPIDSLSKDKNNKTNTCVTFSKNDKIYGVGIDLNTRLDSSKERNQGRIVLDNFSFLFY